MKPDRILLLGAFFVCGLIVFGGCASTPAEPGGAAVEPKEVVEPEAKEAVKPEVEAKEPVKAVVEPKEVVKPVEPAVEAKEPDKAVEPVVEAKEPVKAVVEPKEPEKVVESVAPKPTFALALKYTAGDTVSYKVTTEADKSVLWQGPDGSKPSGFTGGHTGTRVEMTFVQKIKSVGEGGKGVAEITIKGLKYLAKVKDSVVQDFDSSREKDKSNPLNNLVGKSYTIELTASGQVSRVIDVNEATSAVKGPTATDKAARALVSEKVIRERHEVRGLPGGEKREVHQGQTWSSNESFDFGMMGTKAYEKVYTLKGVSEYGGRKVATVEMKAVPSTAGAQEMHKDKATGFLSRMFDNTESFSGGLELVLGSGVVIKCAEQLKSEWLAVDPAAGEDEKQPSALKMAALRLYELERVE